MNPSLDLSLHGWRGIVLWSREPDLFFWELVLGFATLRICRVCLLAKYQEAKAEAAKLRRAVASAVHTSEQMAHWPSATAQKNGEG